ncbi:hypothetical protein LA66_14990 [Aureimonas altamirensis]|uniref:Outer membrane protein beta-barrel domain-containing protein n=1 Tax=Aureimonas altamirensis TaxID=370622 RepID=A0A0B1Q0K1_9HYPH|nr:outer membrane beta-barrel protein [Aureimonas altamirensis]KHJ53889.1 hypothetical protein LA66_14990 [Aureimonas altamirensis]
MRLPAILLAGAAFATPAYAADVIYDPAPAPAPVVFEPAFTWTGFYAGAQAGAAFNTDSGLFDGDTAFGGGSSDGDAGFIGGVHVGYDHQIDNFIIGAVADINYIDADAFSVFPLAGASSGVPGTFAFGAASEIDFVGTVRAKAGFTFDRFAVYATGGLAYASLDDSFTGPGTFTATAATPTGGGFVNGTTYAVSYAEDNDDVGFAVGAGVEYLVTQNFSLGVEYLYHDLGEQTSVVTFTPTAGAGGQVVATASRDLDFHTVWAKASFRFN